MRPTRGSTYGSMVLAVAVTTMCFARANGVSEAADKPTEATRVDGEAAGRLTETWQVSGSTTRTGCRNPMNNGRNSYSGTVVTRSLPGGRYETELTREFGTGMRHKSVGQGTVAADGSYKGTFWEELWVAGRLDSRTEGTAQGRRRGDDDTATFSGRFVVGEICSYTGTSVGRRLMQPTQSTPRELSLTCRSPLISVREYALRVTKATEGAVEVGLTLSYGEAIALPFSEAFELLVITEKALNCFREKAYGEALRLVTKDMGKGVAVEALRRVGLGAITLPIEIVQIGVVGLIKRSQDGQLALHIRRYQIARDRCEQARLPNCHRLISERDLSLDGISFDSQGWLYGEAFSTNGQGGHAWGPGPVGTVTAKQVHAVAGLQYDTDARERALRNEKQKLVGAFNRATASR